MKKGFTLIELLIVVAIIGILSSVVVITLLGQTTKAADATLKTNLRSLAAITSDAASRTDYFDFTSFCDVTQRGNSSAGQIAYGVRGIMNSVFEGAELDPSLAISDTNTNNNGGTISYYYAAVDGDGEQVSNDNGNLTAEYGCASHSSGWAAWGKLNQNTDNDADTDFYCLDSFGSNGVTELTEAPTKLSSISVPVGGRLTCSAIEAAS